MTRGVRERLILLYKLCESDLTRTKKSLKEKVTSEAKLVSGKREKMEYQGKSAESNGVSTAQWKECCARLHEALGSISINV